jgi:hypothetical protein
MDKKVLITLHFRLQRYEKKCRKARKTNKSLVFEENNINNLRPNKLSGAQKI